MKRWIISGIVAMALMFGGSLFAYRAYKQSRPSPVWVPLQINPELPTEKQDQIAKELKTKLLDHDYLVQVSKDLGLMKEWQLDSDEKCADEIAKRLFVKVGTFDTEKGRVPSINIGVNGVAKESGLSSKIAMHLTKHVWELLGLDAPKGK